MTNFQKIAILFIVVCLMIIVTGVCCKISYHKGYTAGWQECLASIQVDTTQHTDTSSYVNPEPISVEPIESTPAGYVLVKAGTIAQMRARIAKLEAAAHGPDAALVEPEQPAPVDSIPVEVPLQVERKVYQDSTYRAVVEGIQARLAEIQTFNTTTTITKILKEPTLPKLVISPALRGIMVPGAYGASAMVTFDSWHGNWRFFGGGGYGVMSVDGAVKSGWVAEGGVKFDIVIK